MATADPPPGPRPELAGPSEPLPGGEGGGAGEARLAALRAELLELCEKYGLLLALSAGEAGRTIGRRDAMREVAARFPGALREWEAVPAPELVRRRAAAQALLGRLQEEGGLALAAVEAALVGEPALRFGAAVHGHLSELLRVRRFLGQQARDAAGRPIPVPIDEALLAACLETCAAEVPGALRHLRLSTALLASIARPAAGRLSALAYAQVAARHGVSVAAVKAALFAEGAPA